MLNLGPFGGIHMPEPSLPEHIHVLLIEDNPDEAKLIRAFLVEKEASLFKLTSADRLSTGLEILTREKPDIILLDLNLPDSSGLATFRRTRDHAVDIPIVILSSTSDEETVLTAIREGAQDYLVKEHLTRRDLVRAIRYAIERKQAEQALRESEQRLCKLLDDRERMSRDLHDNIIQMLYAIGMGLEECRRPLEKDSEPAYRIVGSAIEGLNAVIRDVRTYISELEPQILSGQQLRAELAKLVQTMEAPHLLRFRLSVDPTTAARLTSEEANHVLYIAREAMSNSLRHSHAKTGSVSLRLLRRNVRLEVVDDGVGFDMQKKTKRGEGLRNITARAEELGAKLEIASEPGKGVRVVLDIPKESVRASA